MAGLSNSDIARGSGYELDKAIPVNSDENLPQRIAVVAEMNHANQTTALTPTKITSRQQSAALYGWGSPMDMAIRILFPSNGGGLDGVDVYAYPVVEAGSAAANKQSITASGTATANVTHTLLICGRAFLEGGIYQINIVTGDGPVQIHTKIKNAINAVLGCPVTAADGPNTIVTTTLGSGGTGYVANDLFTISTGTTLATGKVLTVSSGAVLTYSILTGGLGYSIASGVATVATLGSGTGLTINVTVVAVGNTAATANWKGATSEAITIHVLTNGNAAGISYAVAEVTAGSGIADFTAPLASFQSDWNTIVVDGNGILDTVTNAICNSVNGNANTRTGKWDPLVFIPAIYIAGNVTDSTTSSADTVITDAMLNEMTLASGSCPNSLGMPIEAAANYALNFANISANNPNVDIQAIPLPDMPGILPGGANPTQSSSYTLRNALIKQGMSTVIYQAGRYYPQDFVTTYHPIGETPPPFSYCRDIMIDANIRFKFNNMQKAVIENKQIAADDDQVNKPNVVKPKDVKAALVKLANSLASQGLITDAKFMISTISVIINTSNKNRFDISFSYDRSGVVRVISNVATVNV